MCLQPVEEVVVEITFEETLGLAITQFEIFFIKSFSTKFANKIVVSLNWWSSVKGFV